VANLHGKDFKSNAKAVMKRSFLFISVYLFNFSWEERKEGRKEGRKERRKKERKEERKEGRKEGRKQARKEGRKYETGFAGQH